MYLGTPEVGGLTSIQAIEIVRGCKGLNIIGADLVEVVCLSVCHFVKQQLLYSIYSLSSIEKLHFALF